MGLLEDLETQPEREIPPLLPTKRQQALEHYQPHCSRCALSQRRRHRYDRAIITP